MLRISFWRKQNASSSSSSSNLKLSNRRSATASESKTSVIARTCSKAVVHTPICLTTSSLLNSYYLHKCFSKPSLDITNTYSSILSIIFGRTFREMKNIVVALPPSCTSCPKEFRGHPKIVKKVKRRRDRAPSRLPKKIIRSMKKRRVRWKLKSILRKYIPKSSRLYGLVTDYKLAYCSLRNEMGRNEMEMEICSLRNGNL